MASPGNRHCANCIGTLSFPIHRVSRMPEIKKTYGRKGGSSCKRECVCVDAVIRQITLYIRVIYRSHNIFL